MIYSTVLCLCDINLKPGFDKKKETLTLRKKSHLEKSDLNLRWNKRLDIMHTKISKCHPGGVLLFMRIRILDKIKATLSAVLTRNIKTLTMYLDYNEIWLFIIWGILWDTISGNCPTVSCPVVSVSSWSEKESSISP